jgi:hypothetical protein
LNGFQARGAIEAMLDGAPDLRAELRHAMPQGLAYLLEDLDETATLDKPMDLLQLAVTAPGEPSSETKDRERPGESGNS